MNQTRFYHVSDPNFIAFASQIINLIEEEKAKFEAFSVYFTTDSLQALNINFQQANAIPSDKVHVDIQAKATEDTRIELDKCGKFFQRCKFDIEMVFPNNKHLWNQFGFNDYLEARKSAKNMFMFLTDFHLISSLHKDKLMESAWTEATYASILEHKDMLKLSMDRQTKSMVDRGRATEERIASLNGLYEKLAVYMKAAKIIFAENEELLKWFKFPAQANNKVPETEAQEENN